MTRGVKINSVEKLTRLFMFRWVKCFLPSPLYFVIESFCEWEGSRFILFFLVCEIKMFSSHFLILSYCELRRDEIISPHYRNPQTLFSLFTPSTFLCAFQEDRMPDHKWSLESRDGILFYLKNMMKLLNIQSSWKINGERKFHIFHFPISILALETQFKKISASEQ